MDIHTLYKKISNHSVSTDSRTIKEGDIYLALNGDNFNGNTFAKNALNKGAKYAIIDDKSYYLNKQQYILVKDSLKTLQEIAHFHRKQFNIPLIAIAGSNGKTTTKELMVSVLESQYKVTGTKGNFNNHIGLPLSLLNINSDTEIAVIEMGANNPGEIKTLCEIAAPNYGIITNIGKEHLEGFGDLEGVLNANAELFDYLRKNEGIVFVNQNDNKLLNKVAGLSTIISYGKTKNAKYHGEILSTFPHLNILFENTEIKSNLVGDYNFENIMSAIAVGKTFNISNEKIKTQIEHYYPQNNRSQLIKKGSNHIILDAYNANPSSMEKAINNLANSPGNKKIVILGEMLEMGAHAKEEHQTIFNLTQSKGFQKILLIGKEFEPFAQEPNVFYFKNTSEARTWFVSQDIEETTILIKGSRKNKLEDILR